MYIKVTIDYGVLMSRWENTSMNAIIHGYTDSDFTRDQDDKKSISDYLFIIGGAPISRSSRK